MVQVKKLLHQLVKNIPSVRRVQPNQNTRTVPGVFGRMHRFDFMTAGDDPASVQVYNRIGTSACALIEQGLSLNQTTWQDVGALLDYGCGYGRVTRALVQKMKPSKISVFDVDSGAVEFCATEFKVHPLRFEDPMRWDFERVPFGTYDVIWLGSVFTHLSRPYTEEMFKLLFRLLRPKGLLIFTTHGEQTLHRTSEGFYGPYFQSAAPAIIREFEANKFAFVPYERQDISILPFEFERAADFGMTWMDSNCVEAMAQAASAGTLKQLMYQPLGWENHQDVYVYQRMIT